MRNAMLVPAALLSAACSTTKVSVNYDRTLDFGTFHTYSWARPPAPPEGTQPAVRPESTRNSLITKQIVAAKVAELRKKGFKPVETAGDLEVHLQTDVTRGYDVVSYGYGPHWGARRGSAQVRAVGVGSLVVDLVDPRKKELAWRAVARDELDPEISPADRESRLAAVTEKMFRDFPPRP